MKRILLAAVCVILALAMLVSCGGGNGNDNTTTTTTVVHAHTYNNTWSYDETSHWYGASCEHTSEKLSSAPHADANNDSVCDVCGYDYGHTHEFAAEWSHNDTSHWYASTCSHEVKKDEGIHADTDNNGICDVCSWNYDHLHTYEDKWTYDNSHHWHKATCTHQNEIGDKAAHVDENNDGVCDICTSDGGHSHTYAQEWSTDNDFHWNDVTCGHTVEVGNKGVHADTDGDGRCDTCDFVPEHIHSFEEVLSSNKDGHYYKSTCGHTDVMKDFALHTDVQNDDGVCDICSYVMFVLYKVNINAPDYITVEKTISVKQGSDAVFTVTVPDSAELLEVVGATLAGTVKGDKVTVYTYVIEAVTSNKTVTVTANSKITAEVIGEGDGSITVDKSIGYVYGKISFTAPSAGRYLIYSTDNEYIEFGDKDDASSFVNSYVFDVNKAGKAELDSRYFTWSSGDKVEFEYVVLKITTDSLTIKDATGSGYTMPSNIFINITYVFPKAGLYQITTGAEGIAWNDELTDAFLVKTSNDNEAVTFTVKCIDASAATFEFDWSIELLEPSTFNKGENAVKIPLNKYVSLSFTADKKGAYMFIVDHQLGSISTWYEDFSIMMPNGNTYITELEAGEEIILYINLADYEDTITADVDTSVSIDFMGRLVVNNGGVLASDASAEGESNAYENDGTVGEYVLEAPDGALISIDGGKTWHSSVTVELEEYQILAYQVKSTDGSTEVNITFTRLAYEYNFNMGENNVTLVPGEQYTVFLGGFESEEFFHSFILSWNDPEISVSFGNAPVTSGAQYDNYSSYSSFLVIVNNSAESKTLTFTLEEVGSGSGSGSGGADDSDRYATLVLGENSVHVTITDFYANYVEATFTASQAGTYTVSAADGENNAIISVTTSTSSEDVELPYQFELGAGESVTFIVSTSADVMNNTGDDIDLVIAKA